MTERSLALSKQVLVGGVVLVDQERVREIEPNPPERIAVARRLIDPDLNRPDYG